GAGIEAFRRHQEAADLGLGGLVEDEALPLRVDAVDQSALVGSGVHSARCPQCQAEDVLLFALEENPGLAFRGHLVNAPLRAGPRIQGLATAIDGQTPDVRTQVAGKNAGPAGGVDAHQLTARSRTGVDRAVGAQGERKDLAILATASQTYPPL